MNRRTRAQAIPGALPSSLEFKFRDEGVRSCVNPYWVKVTQSDGSLAWSSPVCAGHP